MPKELRGNYEWLAGHGKELDKYAGKWVAIGGRKLIAADKSLKKLMANPKVKKKTHPFFTKIPFPEEAVAIL